MCTLEFIPTKEEEEEEMRFVPSSPRPPLLIPSPTYPTNIAEVASRFLSGSGIR